MCLMRWMRRSGEQPRQRSPNGCVVRQQALALK